MSGVIKVANGGVLNINGTNTIIEFADSKLIGKPCRIEVYPGGKVNINGATLTSIINCQNSMWDGIQMIGGGNNQPQNNIKQSNVNLTNAVVQNARLAIANGVGTNTGGWIVASNTKFLNNYMDVDILPYVAPLLSGNEPNNKTVFTNCVFKADKYLNDPSYIQQVPGTPYYTRLVSAMHVRLNGVKGIRFVGNTFKTDLVSAIGGQSYVMNFRGTGIESSNSIFDIYSSCLLQDINGNCTGYGTPNTFENLLYGVIAGSSNSLKTFNITAATFKNCNSSIYQSGINYSKVNKNTFLIDVNLPQYFGKFNCTIHPEACMSHFYYANNSSNLFHQENNYSVAAACTQQVMGTIFNGSGTASFESYKNKYTNLYIGHQTQLINGATTGGMNGLQIKCNQNITTRQYDVSQTSGVTGEQGYCLAGNITTPANNIFSHYQILPPSDINGYTSGGFIYNYPASPVSTSPTNGYQDPIYKTSNIVKNGCAGPNFVYNTNTCPSKLTLTGTLPPGGQIAKLQTDALANRTTVIQLNQALIDGASQTLLNAIESSTDEAALKNLLSQYSPYLSDDVLIAYLKKTPSPTNGHIQQIVVENSPVTAKVMEVIDAKNLPNGVRNRINNSQSGISARAEREKEIAYYNFQKDLNVNDIVRYYLDDTIIPYGYDNIIKWLEWNNTLPSKLDLIFAKTEIGDFTRAQFLIDSLSTDSSNVKYISFLQVNKDMTVSGKTWDSLLTDPSATNIIETIAKDSLHPHMGHARAALVFAVREKKHYEFIEGVTIQNPSSRLATNASNNSIVDKAIEGIDLIAYPNPFKGELNINYSILDFDGFAQLQLIELASGRIIDVVQLTESFGIKQFNTQNLSNGLYVLSLKQNNKPSVNFKVINIR